MINFLKSLFWTVVVWSILYGFEIYKGWTTNSLVLQTIFCTFFFLNALASVPHYESREIIYRILNSKAFDLYEGIYFFPLLGLWGQIYTPPEYRSEEKSFTHFDSRQVFRKREVKSRLEDFLISIVFPMFRKYEAWNFGLCVILGLGLAWCSLKVNQTLFNPKTETVGQHVPEMSSSKLSQASNNSSSLPKEDFYEIMPNPDPLFSLDGGINYYGNNLDYVSLDPGNPNFDIKWNSVLKKYDDYTLAVKVNNRTDYVYETGYFMSPETSENFFPKVYVDGYKGDQDYFEKFFYVHINRLIIPRDNPIINKDIGLKEYVNFLKTDKRINMYCFRDITIVLRKEFQDKLTWYLVDAGWGNDKKFTIFHGSSQVVLNK